MKTDCRNCKFHEDYWDEGEDMYYDDGCICTHEIADKKYHTTICYKYSDNKKGLKCPYLKKCKK